MQVGVDCFDEFAQRTKDKCVLFTDGYEVKVIELSRLANYGQSVREAILELWACDIGGAHFAIWTIDGDEIDKEDRTENIASYCIVALLHD